MYNIHQKLLIFGNLFTMFFGLQTLGVLVDEQIIIMSWYNNLLTNIAILSIPFILIHFKKYFCIWFYVVGSFIVGISSLYYDHVLLINRGFGTFGIITPSMLIVGGGISLISLFYLYRIKVLYK